VEKYGRARGVTVLRRKRLECWITKATDTHSAYVILNAFPRKQWLRERAPMLRYTYIACLVTLKNLVLTRATSKLQDRFLCRDKESKYGSEVPLKLLSVS
jgi:hypothetical protein